MRQTAKEFTCKGETGCISIMCAVDGVVWNSTSRHWYMSETDCSVYTVVMYRSVSIATWLCLLQEIIIIRWESYIGCS